MDKHRDPEQRTDPWWPGGQHLEAGVEDHQFRRIEGKHWETRGHPLEPTERLLGSRRPAKARARLKCRGVRHLWHLYEVQGNLTVQGPGSNSSQASQEILLDRAKGRWHLEGPEGARPISILREGNFPALPFLFQRDSQEPQSQRRNVNPTTTCTLGLWMWVPEGIQPLILQGWAWRLREAKDLPEVTQQYQQREA